VAEVLNKREIKQYIDTVFLDTGYRNRFKLSETLDLLIEKKLEEAEETQIYTNKDMADLLAMAHKMRIEELKAQTEMEKAKALTVRTQVNIQDNSGLPFGQGNYGKLLEKLMKEDK
jgi:phage terminase small subunit